MTAIDRIRTRCLRADRGHETLCLIWPTLNGDGYGQIKIGSRTNKTRRNVRVHRVMWEHAHGPIPSDLQIDHLCRQRDCCEVTHLELVTLAENVRRGLVSETNRRRGRERTHCKYGHEFTPENTYVPRKGGRACRRCHREYELLRYHLGKAL